MLIKKPPIIVVLGHVDHGKTTLLDYLRKSNLSLKEAGGITQKIGAYEIEFEKEKLTFIDTPGHSAFNNLRERGVKIADIGILVVAADEGVKEQTKESLFYLRSSKIPFVVALNKIDKKEADPQKIISQLVELEVIPEKWGGQTPIIEISAKTGQGVNELLETLILLRDIYDLKVDIDKPGSGFILEAIKDPQRGILASAVVVEGKVELSNFIITPTTFGKIKIFEDDLGRKINVALPSKPILVGNFNDLPTVGELFVISSKDDFEKVYQDLKRSEDSIKKRYLIEFNKNKDDFSDQNVNLIIIKADNIGSLEALENIFQKIIDENKLNLKIIKADIGPVTLEDIQLAKDLDAIIISFNVKNQRQILDDIKKLNLKFFENQIIYKIEEEFLNFFENKQKEIIESELEVLAVFTQTKTKKTVGGQVKIGSFKIGQKIIILREGVVIGQGKIISIEKNKLPADEVKENELCGLIIETAKEIAKGDIIKIQK